MDSTKHYYEQFGIQNILNLEMVDHTVILNLLSKTNISKAAGIDKAIGGGIGSFWNFDIIYIPSESHMSLVFKMPKIFEIGSAVQKLW